MRMQSRHDLMLFQMSIMQTKPRRIRVTPAIILRGHAILLILSWGHMQALPQLLND